MTTSDRSGKPRTAARDRDTPPLGIKLYGVLVTFTSVVTILVTLAVAPPLLLFVLPLAALSVVVAYGLWQMATWAWYAALILHLLNLIVQGLTGDAGFIVSLVILAYLFWIGEEY